MENIRAVLVYVLSNDDKNDDDKNTIKKMTIKNITLKKMIESENEKLVQCPIAVVLGFQGTN